MKNINIFTIIFFSILIQACTDKKKQQNDEDYQNIVIDLTQKTEEKRIDDVALSMSFLKLEESDEYPIGYIDKIIITNTSIYILDKQRSKSLFLYDRNGNLQKVIHRTGNGPEEYIMPNDFDIQESTGNIIILDGNQRKLLFYTKKGDFISELNLNAFINSFVSIENDNIILDKGNYISDESLDYIRIIDAKGNKIIELLPIPEYSREITISPRHPLQKKRNTVLFMPSLSNQIYQIQHNKVGLKYQLDFGKYWPRKEYFENEKGKHPLKIAQNLVKNAYAAFFNYLDTKEVLHVNFEYENKPFSFFYNKNSGESILFYSSNQDISLPLTTAETSFVCAGYSEDNNPVLIFYDIKW
jgi:hypothetical protein